MKKKIYLWKVGKISFSKIGLIYILLMTIGNVHQAGLYNGYYLTQFIVSTIFFALGIYKFLAKGVMLSRLQNEMVILKIVIFPWAIFFIYNLFLYVSGNGKAEFLKSSFVQIMFTPIILLGAWGAFFLMGKNTLRYLIYSYVISYIITLTILMFRWGPSQFLEGVVSGILGGTISNPFEKNSDLVLALGLLVIYYLDYYIRNGTKERVHTFIFIVLVFLGGKRIVFLAAIAMGMLIVLTSRLGNKKKIIMQNIVSVIFLIGNVIFVYLVISQLFSAFVYSKGINAMGRMQMWDYIAQYAEFTPLYLGKGYAFANLELEAARIWTWQGHVYALHSDVLKVYIELGFAMFLFWIVYSLFIASRKIGENFGVEVRSLYWFMTVYLFILYLTDNAINYFIVQNLFCVLLFQITYYKSFDFLEGKK